MRTLLLFFYICLLILPATAAATDEIDEFLGSRQVISQIFFDKRAFELSVESRDQLDSAADKLRDLQSHGKLVRVEGFSSPDGDDKFNLKLSMQRALAVEKYLLQNHNLNSYVFLTGFGEKNTMDDTLEASRRVDVAIYTKNSATKTLLMKPVNQRLKGLFCNEFS